MEIDAWTISGSCSPLPSDNEPENSVSNFQDRNGVLGFFPRSVLLQDGSEPVLDSSESPKLVHSVMVTNFNECSKPSSLDGISTPFSSIEDPTSRTYSQSTSSSDEFLVSAPDSTDKALYTTEQALNTIYQDEIVAHAHATQSDFRTTNAQYYPLYVTSNANNGSTEFEDVSQISMLSVRHVPIRTVSHSKRDTLFPPKDEQLELSIEAQTKHADAEILRLRLQWGVKLFEPYNPVLFKLQMQFGAMLIEVGRYRDAEDEFDKAVRRVEKLYGANDDRTMEALMQLGIASLRNGNPKRAEDMFEKVVSFRIQAFGREHPKTLSSLGNKALALSDQARWDECEILEKEVMNTSLQSSLLGPEHRDTLASRSRVIVSHLHRGRYTEAAEMGQELVEDCIKHLGDKDPITLVSKSNLASAMSGLGCLEYAVQLESEMVDISKQRFGLKHPDTLNKMLNLAMTYLDLSEKNESTSRYQAMRQLKRAAIIMEEVVERLTVVLGDSHVDTLVSINSLVLIRLGQGRFTEGEEMGRKLVETCKRARSLGPNHPKTLDCMDTHSQALAKQRRFPEAIKVMEECVLLSREKLGPDHPDTLDSVEALDELCQQMRVLRT
jgi:tetratricopeptide (TPR) repeat protein